ncbi:MAG: drug resistance transporter, EmrB/QacA subfamily [Gemmatimonadetes bacterium]|nr:drug resistance transporter, EmrB/QacA subfamily [Gemmatimonadota bacterium]
MSTSALDAPAAPAPLAHRQVLIAFSGLLLAMLLAALDSTIVSTALPTIVGELGGLEHLAWVVTGYLLAQTVVTPVYGKLGDLYGRKIVMQSAIVLFLVGSVLCGLSRNMTQLIVFRFIQGLGGGGLNVTTQAIVGDIVPPRERGRYQGIFGALFGLASVAGPLLGGFFTTHLTWRWIFYVNLPLGAVALVVLAATLPQQSMRKVHAIDFAGAALLAVTLSSLTLLADLGGSAYPWSSPMVLGMIAAAALGLALFVLAERRALEPVLPLRLFGQRTFLVATLVGLIVGFALFGSVTYLPVYLQVVRGQSPTRSGLQMLPMMGGMLLTSVLSGQLISRTGRYKIFPVLGTGVMTVGLFFLSRLAATSTPMQASVLMLVLGLGIGMVMQVLVIAVQNAAEYRDLGVATSGATLFRLIGGSLGTAILGAVFASRLASNLASALPGGAPGGGGTRMTASALAAMSPEMRAAYSQAFTASLDTVFLVATVVCAVGFVLALMLPERPLRETIATTAREGGRDAAGAFGQPSDENAGESMLLNAFRTLADRDIQAGHIQRIVDRAGESLSPLGAWLLVQIERAPGLDVNARTGLLGIPQHTTDAAIAELEGRGLIRVEPARRAWALTVEGCDVNDRLVEARHAHLRDLLAEWNEGGHTDADEFLRAAVEDMVPPTNRSS